MGRHKYSIAAAMLGVMAIVIFSPPTWACMIMGCVAGFVGATFDN